MREQLVGFLLGLIVALGAGAAAHRSSLTISDGSPIYLVSYQHKSVTLPVQQYGFNLSPQGAITISQMYYTVNGIHALVIQASSSKSLVVSQVSSDARRYNVTGFKITQASTWFIIPGWNCGYTNDNGRPETTLLATSTVTYSLDYNCVYPPTATNVTFTGLVAPIHTPCTYVGSIPASCTSLVD